MIEFNHRRTKCARIGLEKNSSFLRHSSSNTSSECWWLRMRARKQRQKQLTPWLATARCKSVSWNRSPETFLAPFLRNSASLSLPPTRGLEQRISEHEAGTRDAAKNH